MHLEFSVALHKTGPIHQTFLVEYQILKLGHVFFSAAKRHPSSVDLGERGKCKK